MIEMTQEDFDRLLRKALADDVAHNGTDVIFAIPGAYEVLAEDFNNEVIKAWEDEQRDILDRLHSMESMKGVK